MNPVKFWHFYFSNLRSNVSKSMPQILSVNVIVVLFIEDVKGNDNTYDDEKNDNCAERSIEILEMEKISQSITES